MAIGDSSDDREAEATSDYVTDSFSSDLLKRQKQQVNILRRDHRTRVADEQSRPPSGGPCRNFDGAAGDVVRNALSIRFDTKLSTSLGSPTTSNTAFVRTLS
ncbi:MAG: hypothetical protein JWM85_2153 [Acidimicrobiaceae bacterium]|nr:hypothetical protein [Acidimicrobiaceae bacterium]